MLPADTCWGRKWLFYAPKPQLAKEPVYLPSKQKDVIEDLTSITLPLGLTSCILIHQKEKKKKDSSSERFNATYSSTIRNILSLAQKQEKEQES